MSRRGRPARRLDARTVELASDMSALATLFLRSPRVMVDLPLLVSVLTLFSGGLLTSRLFPLPAGCVMGIGLSGALVRMFTGPLLRRHRCSPPTRVGASEGRMHAAFSLRHTELREIASNRAASKGNASEARCDSGAPPPSRRQSTL